MQADWTCWVDFDPDYDESIPEAYVRAIYSTGKMVEGWFDEINWLYVTSYQVRQGDN